MLDPPGVPLCISHYSLPLRSPAHPAHCREVQAEGRLKRDVLLCYDLELPEDFVPRPQVGGAAWYAALLHRILALRRHTHFATACRCSCSLLLRGHCRPTPATHYLPPPALTTGRRGGVV